MTDLFSLHPFVSLFYFISVFIFVMFCQNPLFSFIALIGGVVFLLKMKKRADIKGSLLTVAAFFVIAVSNPLFSHNGVTVLFFLNNNPVTLESFYYGIYLAVMLIAVFIWFRSFNAVITDDKWLCLSAKISPKLSVLLSIVFRFIPRFRDDSKKIRNAQKTLGLFSGDSWFDNVKSTLGIYSVLISRGLESAIDVGASMKARGYGLKGRSSYSLYRFRLSDAAVLLLIALADALIIFLLSKPGTTFVFYPSTVFPAFGLPVVLSVCTFSFLCFLPFILSVREDIKWHYLRSKI